VANAADDTARRWSAISAWQCRRDADAVAGSASAFGVVMMFGGATAGRYQHMSWFAVRAAVRVLDRTGRRSCAAVN
jgi:hypothetical protein